MALRMNAGDNVIRQFSRPFLLAHHKRHVFEKGFVKLHNAFQNMCFLRQARAKTPIPATNRIVREAGNRRSLFNGFANRPAPENEPKFFIREFPMREPGMREEREFGATFFAAVAGLITNDLAGAAFGTEHILPEEDPAQIPLDLRLRRYLT